MISVCSSGFRVRADVELGWVHWALTPTNDPAPQEASLIGQSVASKRSEGSPPPMVVERWALFWLGSSFLTELP